MILYDATLIYFIKTELWKVFCKKPGVSFGQGFLLLRDFKKD